jgi:hypothetical protein
MYTKKQKTLFINPMPVWPPGPKPDVSGTSGQVGFLDLDA